MSNRNCALSRGHAARATLREPEFSICDLKAEKNAVERRIYDLAIHTARRAERGAGTGSGELDPPILPAFPAGMMCI